MAESKQIFDFHWQYDPDDDGDGPGSNEIQIGNPDEVTPVRLAVSNILADKTITVHKVSDTVADEGNCHFKLNFRPGVLVDPGNILAGGNWSLKVVPGSADGDDLYLLWLGEDVDLAPGTEDVLEVALEKVATNVPIGGMKTDLYISWQFEEGGIDFIEVPKAPGQDEYKTEETLELSMVTATGKTNIPLFVGFVNSNKILNVNDDTSNLQLRVTNTNLPDSDAITFTYDSSQLMLMLEVGDAATRPWTLGTLDQVRGITISVTNESGDSDIWEKASDEEIIIVDDEIKGVQWRFGPKAADVVLHPQETLLINLDGIVTGHSTGPTNLYLRCAYIEGYKDNQFTCQVEKSPLIFENGNVGIRTTEPSATLDVNGNAAIRGNIQDTLNFGAQTRQMLNLYNQECGIGVQDFTIYFRSSKNFAWYRNGIHDNTELSPGDDGTVDMVLNDGNVGIGTNSPSHKLTVEGDAKVSGTSTANQLTVEGDASVSGESTTNKLTVEGNASVSGESTTNKLTVGGETKLDGLMTLGLGSTPIRQIVVGKVSETGKIMEGSGFTSKTIDNGKQYEVTFSSTLLGTPLVIATIENDVSSGGGATDNDTYTITCRDVTTNGFKVAMQDLGGDRDPNRFSFMAIVPA